MMRGGLLGKLRASPLGLKLAILSGGMTVLVVGFAFLALRQRVDSDVRTIFSEELSGSQRGLGQLQGQNLRLLMETSALVSTSPTLRAALQTSRMEANAGLPARADLLETIRREVERIFADLDRDLMVVTDERGHVLAAAGREGKPAPGEDLSRLPAIRQALATDPSVAPSAFGVLRVGNRNLQVGCVAIQLEGYAIGVLVIGDRLDQLVPRLGVTTGTRTVVTADSEVLSSSLEGLAPGSRWNASNIDTAGRLTRYRGADYVSATLSLGKTDDGRTARLQLLRSLTASLNPVQQSLGRSFILLGLIAVLLAGCSAAIVSRTTLKPLSRFIKFMQTGAEAGALTQFVDPAAPPEIRMLTDAFNRLIASLARQHGQLEERTVELASANESLQQQVIERETAERALLDSEEQLRQSQKLEALGTLAGGVAHDFNNMLSVIIGYSQIVAQDAPDNSPLKDDVEQISSAAERAAGLVRQLLAFSRKQVLQPRIIDLNQTVSGMLEMLRRLIGEDIDLQIELEPRLSRIKADQGQIEQVLMNLVVNARDAMPTGGKLVIGTSHTQLDDRYERRLGAMPGGLAVTLTVSDSGMGMDAATRERIFEPFFTTKPVGKGTGLGLATVYGVVRQSGGSITAFSEPGEGCTMRCYFPPMLDAVGPMLEHEEAAAPHGNETVLVAEDDPQLRALVCRCLLAGGYSVLEACDGAEALEVAAAHIGPLELLVSDVVMPNVSGKELAERLLLVRPGLLVLFMSGYSDAAIARHGELTPGATFLQKPVAPDALLRTVREILDAEPAKWRVS